jgi:signal transduction histidine kinase/CheY-like chemotaxis protein
MAAPLTQKQLERRLARERAAREEAERLLEEKSRKLFNSNETLRMALAGLEHKIEDRTKALAEEVARRQVAMEEAIAANRAKSEFLSSMSHELRTPLNAILGFAQVLRDNPKAPLTEKQKLYTAHIMNAGQHLLALITDVLDLSRIDSGKLTLSLEPLEVLPLIRDCITATAGSCERMGVTITAENTGPLPPVRADQTRLKQVLLNLLSNAVKYNRPQGTVIVSCNLLDTDPYVRITVADTGLGIPDEQKSKLFEPFERLGRENGSIDGTGIGLTITRRLIAAMGGRIDFESTEGVGTKIWVDLPTAKGMTIQSSSQETSTGESTDDSAPALPRARRTVLYVEDNPLNRALVESIADSLTDVHLIMVETGEAGIAAAETVKPDLILMDIHLPGIKGPEALQAIRLLPGLSTVPAIAVSAAAMADSIEMGLEIGFNGYLTKPFNIHDLTRLMSEGLDAIPQLQSVRVPK